MLNNFRSVAVVAGLVLTTSAALAQRTYTGVIVKRYAELCASCHGKNLEGASAPSMLDDVWTRGGDDESLAKSIREGFPDKGMPAWSTALPEREIRSFVIFIREQRSKFQREKLKYPPLADSLTLHAQKYGFELKTWVRPIREPWSLAFLPDHSALVTEKSGRLLLIHAHTLSITPITGLPPLSTAGDCGLFDVILHPNFADNGWVYISCSDPAPPPDTQTVSHTRIVRGRIRDGSFVDAEVVFKVPARFALAPGGSGGRMAFGRDGCLYFSISDFNHGWKAQDLDTPIGKIHRVLQDGRIPPDNPFVNTPGACASIWSYGHRNPQGLCFDPATGQLFSAEHGPRGGDEVNLIMRGRNYGWPVITYGMNYDGTAISDLTAKPGMEQPVVYWTPSIAPCGINFYEGDLFPEWKHQLFVTSLAAEELRRLEIKEGKLIGQEVLLKNVGRLRHIITGPDGAMYLLMPDRICRIAPLTQSSGPAVETNLAPSEG